MSTAQTDFLRYLRTLTARQATGLLSDQQLLERFLHERSEASFATLVARHGPMVLSVCRRILQHAQDAEDAFQATFLVLARKANSIRKQASLGSWLHGVAYHSAECLKAKARRRAAHERRWTVPPQGDAMGDITWRELRSVLDDELAKLSEQHRAPLVLCYLEGRTQDEAAQQLGWSKNTFRRRLQSARDALGRRLTRRGVTLSASLSASLPADAAVQAALPPLLASTTVRAGMAAATGQATGTLVSVQASALVEGGAGSLLTKKASLAVVVLASLILSVGGLLAHRAIHGPSFAEAPTAPPALQSQSARSVNKERAIEIKGRVFDPDGKPFAGATVYFVPNAARKRADLKVRTPTDKNGRFRLTVAAADVASDARLLAVAPGHGPDWTDVSKENETVLRLVKDDVPLRGRVIDLEGQPIAGVTVEVGLLAKPVDGDLTPWLEIKTKKSRDRRRAEMKYLWPALLDGQFTAKTDADGRFRMSGFGRERLVHLNVTGPSIESYPYVRVLTRSGPATGWAANSDRIYAASFDFVAGPCKPILGTVRDRATGKPLAGIQVGESYIKLPPGEIPGHARAITDEKGRYRLTGIGKRKEYAIAAEGWPYFNVTKENLVDTPGLEPITVDFELTRGIPVRGRLTDRATGKPVRGRVMYLARAENPHLKDYRDFGREGFRFHRRGETSEDGSFTVLAIPGPGFLCVSAYDSDRYIHIGLKDWNGSALPSVPFGYHPSQFLAVVPLDVSAKGGKSTHIDIALEPGRTRTGTVVGPDGQPLAGAHVAGLTPVPHSGHKLPTATFTVLGLNPRKSHNIVFFHPEKKLGKVQAVRGDEAGSLTVPLEPLGGVSGRILDANGRPWAGLTVRADLRRPITAYKDLPWELLDLRPTMEVKTTTDREGKYRIDGLLPGVPYNLAFGVDEIKRRTTVAAYPLNVTVAVGKIKDLGDLKSKLTPEK
jgi:RNA polymerase sigma factor (sigma-70 family)